MKKALVLSSGGVDSTTCVGIAVKDVGSENVVMHNRRSLKRN